MCFAFYRKCQNDDKVCELEVQQCLLAKEMFGEQGGFCTDIGPEDAHTIPALCASCYRRQNPGDGEDEYLDWIADVSAEFLTDLDLKTGRGMMGGQGPKGPPVEGPPVKGPPIKGMPAPVPGGGQAGQGDSRGGGGGTSGRGGYGGRGGRGSEFGNGSGYDSRSGYGRGTGYGSGRQYGSGRDGGAGAGYGGGRQYGGGRDGGAGYGSGRQYGR
ncbi:hypothetical protein EJ08DRAFT_253646 [Tothia fuscella]|uniref:Uncharacterized protein n=1 Tax=Tothia fuscella TaxID=1048955 RepID=A0A9P4TXB0_9PEZI|nr:hypothetical protein EJ08DRAFT_253646 [Tothia fuscella]